MGSMHDTSSLGNPTRCRPFPEESVPNRGANQRMLAKPCAFAQVYCGNMKNWSGRGSQRPTMLLLKMADFVKFAQDWRTRNEGSSPRYANKKTGATIHDSIRHSA